MARVFFIVVAMFLTFSCSNVMHVSTTSHSTLYLINGNELAQLKKQYESGNASTVKTINNIIIGANNALKNPLYSVTFLKDTVAISGDKKDYISMGPYWWPDPKKDNGKPYIRRDGEINPERENLRDYYQMLDLTKDVQVLSLGFYFTNNEVYADKVNKLLYTWFVNKKTSMNPHLNYGQGIPGVTNGRGIGIIETKELIIIPDAIALLKESRSIEKNVVAGVKKWFADYVIWLTTSKIGLEEKETKNNHGTYYDLQVMDFALFAGMPELANNILHEKTISRIDTQFRADGTLPLEQERTRSWHYTGMNTLGWVYLAMLSEKIGYDIWNYNTSDNKSLLKTLKYPGTYLLENKEWTHKQIVKDNNDELFLAYKLAMKKYNDEFFDKIKKKYVDEYDWNKLW